MVLRLIQIWRIQKWCSFFFVFDRKYTFFWNFIPKIEIVCWNWNLESRLIWICRIRWKFLVPKYSFCVNLIQKFKRVILRRNLVLSNDFSWEQSEIFEPIVHYSNIRPTLSSKSFSKVLRFRRKVVMNINVVVVMKFRKALMHWYLRVDSTPKNIL